MRFVALITIIAFLNTGCAAMFHGTKEQVNVRSEEPDTRFFVNNREIGKGTSAVTTIAKDNLDKAVLRAEKPGCNTKAAPVETQFDALCLLGILIDFGIVTILLIDWAATGAVTRAAQNDYILTPDCPKQGSQPVSTPTATLSRLSVQTQSL